MQKPFSLLVKPASADCNLNCQYCFYLDKAALYPETPRHRMSEPVLEAMVRSYLATTQPVYSFGWQGGEPTLLGLDFFRRVTDLQQRYGRPGAAVANGVQTNATLLDDPLAEHFVGCSLDGPAPLHDRYRCARGGEPTHARVLAGIRTLQRHGVDFNILTLVSQANVAAAREVYRYLVELGFLYQQYIPCVEFDAAGALQPYAIDGPAWGRFLCELFEEWRARDTYRVSIRHFDALLARLVDGETTVCTLARDCRHYFVVEYNGDIYPCDFFVLPEWRLGNVLESSWEALAQSELYRRFGARKSCWNARCAACRHLDLCAGDCLKHRLAPGCPPETLSPLCEGWSMFLDRTRSDFEALAREVRARRRVDAERWQAAARSGPPPGRNAPCPCGSGRKYKKCCGAA